jgi:cell division protein FtsI/penicillin-binding protein 2
VSARLPKPMPQPQHRILILSAAALVIIGALAARLADLQVVRASYFQAVAENQRKRASELAPRRGTIYLQERGSGELFPVAVNDKAWVAYAVPREMDDPLKIAQLLASAVQDFRHRQNERISDILISTGQEQEPAPAENTDNEAELAALTEEHYRKFNQKTDPYEPLLRFYETLDDQLHNFLAESQLPGIVLEEIDARAYPENTLAAHVLGYLGWQDDRQVGRYGIEGHFDERLAGSLGFFSAEHDSSGSIIGVGTRDFTPATDGDDVVLTIDRVVQSIIEEELADGVERYGATRGSIIVSDPMTGAILGMATYPTYDPNYYYAIKEARVQLNPVVSDIFEPGSILKPLIMAAALAEDIVKPDTTFVDKGPVHVAEYTIDTYDGQHHGVQTMTQILEKSNNVGMVWVGQQLGAEAMYDYLRRFGLGEKTGIELEGETQSTLKEPAEWNVTTVATTSFGQGIALTPLQALNSINVLANGGVLMQPHIVARTQQGDEEKITQPATVQRVIPESAASQATAMLVSVVENGVGQLARVPGYYLAGKTGTAQVPDDQGAYDPDRKIISFVGFGPITRPQFSILIKLDDPAGLSLASGTAAPMFRHISENLLNYYQVPPDYEADSSKPIVPPIGPSDRGAFGPSDPVGGQAG